MSEKPSSVRPTSGYKHVVTETGATMSDIKINRSYGLAQATIGDTIIVVWRDHCVREGWVWHATEIDRAIARNDSVVVLSVVLPTSSPPPAPVRELVTKDMRRWGQGLRRYIFVPLGDSLWLHIVRTTARGVLMLAGMTGRYTVTDTIEDAVSTTVDVASENSPSPRRISATLGDLFHNLGTPQP